MGVSIDTHVFQYAKLLKEIEQWVEDNGGFPEGRTMDEFEEKILPHFGHRAGDEFHVLWNEYYEDYNAGTELLTVVCLYFKKDPEDTPWFDYDYGASGANAHEVMSEVFGDEWDEDET